MAPRARLWQWRSHSVSTAAISARMAPRELLSWPIQAPPVSWTDSMQRCSWTSRSFTPLSCKDKVYINIYVSHYVDKVNVWARTGIQNPPASVLCHSQAHLLHLHQLRRPLSTCCRRSSVQSRQWGHFWSSTNCILASLLGAIKFSGPSVLWEKTRQKLSLTCGWTWGKSGLFSNFQGASEMARSKAPFPQTRWPSHAPAPIPVSDGMGAATRLSLQGACAQSEDASQESNAPAHIDKRASMPSEPRGIMSKRRCCFWRSTVIIQLGGVCPVALDLIQRVEALLSHFRKWLLISCLLDDPLIWNRSIVVLRRSVYYEWFLSSLFGSFTAQSFLFLPLSPCFGSDSEIVLHHSLLPDTLMDPPPVKHAHARAHTRTHMHEYPKELIVYYFLHTLQKVGIECTQFYFVKSLQKNPKNIWIEIHFSVDYTPTCWKKGSVEFTQFYCV